MRAITSALNQTLDKRYYEIIVIKNYKDDKIDELIEKNNIKNIYSSNESLSGKIVEALSYSHGKIISFLEDDDLFLNNKLQYVYNFFNSDKELVFFRNNVSFINNTDNYIADPTPRHRKYISKHKKIKCTECNIKDFIKFYKSDSYFNLSSMSIRKDVYYKFLLGAQNITIGADFLIFYLGFFIDKNMVTTNDKLTLYRITKSHFSNSSNLIGYKMTVGVYIYLMRLIGENRTYLYKSAFVTLEFMKFYLLYELKIKNKKYYIMIFKKISKHHGFLLFIRMHPPYGIYSIYKLILNII